MTVSTLRLEIKSESQAFKAAVKLLTSIRFSISLLTVTCIASATGNALRRD